MIIEEYFADVAQAYREEIKALYDAGCRESHPLLLPTLLATFITSIKVLNRVPALQGTSSSTTLC